MGTISGRTVLRLGQRFLPLDDVCRYRVQRFAERDNEGLLFNFALFGLLACGFVIPVLQQVMDPKFLIAAAMLGAVALMSLTEVIFARKVEYLQLDLLLADGEKVSFVSAFAADVESIAQALANLGARANL